MSALDDLFKAVRQVCSPSTWSQGVELARSGAVVAESLSETESVLRVASPGRAVSATVKVWPEEEDWFCDCRPNLTVCEHVAAAVITLRRSHEQGQSLVVSAVARGIVVYAFSRKNGALSFERRIVSTSGETLLQGRLTSILSGRSQGPALNASKLDVTLDSFLGEKNTGVLSESTLIGTLVHLQESENVLLDGKKISVGKAIPRVQAVVADKGEDIKVSLEQSAQVEEVFSNGALLCAGKLHPKVMPEFTPKEKELLSPKRVVRPHEFAELVSRILPELERKVPVEIRTERLKKKRAEDRPRLLIEATAVGEVLSVLPLIVYGDPPYARVDSGKLSLLGDSGLVPERNVRMENWLAATLHSKLGLSVGKRTDFRADAALRMTKRLGNLDFQVTGGGLAAFVEKPVLVPLVNVDETSLGVTFKLPDGNGTADPRRVFQAWQDGLERVPLHEGGWAPIPKEWLDRYASRILDLLEAKEPGRAFPTHLRPEIASLCETLDVACPTDFSTLKRSLESFTEIKSAPLPKDLTATLRTYQKQGVDWLCFLKQNQLGALLADDMGLGKTLQTLCLVRKPTLVVAPTSVISNWQNETIRFRPSLRICVYHGSFRSLDPDADITLTTYALLRRDVALLSSVIWDMVVLDEAQNIKNPESQVAQAAYQLQAAFKVVLTGTPVENRLEDLWSLFHFLNRGLLGARSGFSQRYGNAPGNPQAAETLRRKIKPFILRRLKQEVAKELPPRTDLTLYCELDPEERATYEAVLATARQDVLWHLEKDRGSVLAALECLLRLRQAACHPALLPGQEAEESSKTRLLLEKIDEVLSEGHKALVFSQWTSLLDLLEPWLRKNNIAYSRIDGSTTASQRSDIVGQFQDPQGPPVLLMTLKAGGVGLNLTAADHVFIVDPWWNPATEDQAADRAHRIGQDRPVFVHRLIAKDTVEEKILLLKEKKRTMAAMALEGGASAVALTREDLLELLN